MTRRNFRPVASASRRKPSTAAITARASRSARSGADAARRASSRRTRSSTRFSRNARASSADANVPAASRQAGEQPTIGWHPAASSPALARNTSPSSPPRGSRAFSAAKTSRTRGSLAASIGSWPSARTSRYRSITPNRPFRPIHSRIHPQSRISHARPAREPSSSPRMRPAPSDGSRSADSSHAISRRLNSSTRPGPPASAALRRSSTMRPARSRYAPSARSASSIFRASSAAFLSSTLSSLAAGLAARSNPAARSSIPRGPARPAFGIAASRRPPPGTIPFGRERAFLRFAFGPVGSDSLGLNARMRTSVVIVGGLRVEGEGSLENERARFRSFYPARSPVQVRRFHGD
ncbi:hypothetical protein OJF2_12610 [Aquisphaera giovannonii]|uniref:Uncharacterized protein n=1 Tax=Aquisphaera giovannonii TaxID=406548 RepID=A0A5B9VYS9_9BACT|nr:hypothetical protein [Aquisphaera giovannonii]QEH32780.1 hypothetical protein OJF2_12610 [Aquisphaera giovannonii]